MMKRTIEHAERITPSGSTEPLPLGFSEEDRLVDDALGDMLRREVSAPRSVTEQTVAASRALLPRSVDAQAERAARGGGASIAGRIADHRIDRMRLSRLALAACVMLVAVLALALVERSSHPPRIATRDVLGELNPGRAVAVAERGATAREAPAETPADLLPLFGTGGSDESDVDYLLATNDISYEELAGDLAMLVREMDL